MIPEEYAILRCPNCRKQFRVLEDEQVGVICPRCGWGEDGDLEGDDEV